MATAEQTAAGHHLDKSAFVWIEDRSGAIVRGRADSLTASGARVRLSEPPSLEAGEVVSLRLCVERDAPTVATAARVISVRVGNGAVECSVEWADPGLPRSALDAWLASAA